MFEKALEKYKKRTGFGQICPKLVLFDMDGVLYDSMGNHAKAWVESMKHFGLTMTEKDAYLTEGQRGIDTIQQMMLLQQGKRITLDEAQVMYDEKARLFSLLPEAPLMPGIKQLMKRITKMNMQIGIVTGSGQLPLIHRIEKDFAEFVSPEQIVTAYDVQKGKPNPEPYLKGMEKAGITQPNQVIVVENAPLGIKAGVASKAFTIGVNTGILTRKELNEAKPDLQTISMVRLESLWQKLMIELQEKDASWEGKCNELIAFVKQHEAGPSKHKAEERSLVNWIKHQRQQINKGLMPEDKIRKFQKLTDLLQKYKRVNQYRYTSGKKA